MASHSYKSNNPHQLQQDTTPEQLRQEAHEIRDRARVRVNRIQGVADHEAAMREAVALHLENPNR